MKKIILNIEGMTCSACSNGLEKYLNKQDGIINANVNLVMANASIEYDEKTLSLQKIDDFVLKAGFKSLGEFKVTQLDKKSKKEKRKFIIFTILACIFMYVAMGHMINLPTIALISIDRNPIGYTVCLFTFALIFMIYGFDILKNGYKNLIHFTPNMDTLVSIGVLSSFLYSSYNMFLLISREHSVVHNLYFESVAMVIYFIKLGRYIDGISKDKTKEAIGKLVSITPENAVIKVDGKEKSVTIDEVKKGDIVISRPGERISVDGHIVEGYTHLDESFITGESKPVAKEVGDKVIAGSINYDGYIEFVADKIGKESTISEIVKLVIEATNTKVPIAKIADKVSGYFVPSVMILAMVTFAIYLILGFSISESLITFVTILVVACPCSLGLATPLAIVVSEGKCASNGILIKKSEILENAEKVNTIVFDKTGTLTYGTLKISEIKNFSNIADQDILELVCSIESKSTHPISKAFIEYLEQNKVRIKKVEKFENINGHGLIGKIEDNELIVGNAKILEKFKINNKYKQEEKTLASNGNSIVYVVLNKKIIALIGINDIERANAKDIIKSLKKQNINTIMLTGDNKETAKKVAKNLGITKVIADILPTDKAKTINELKKKGDYVMMCGDGINDSPALASADIGISIKSGTDIAMDSADVILTKNDLGSILKLIDISKKTIKIIKQNLFWAFFYNIMMIPIATGLLKPFGLLINPMIASLAMVFSSITVILNTLRLKKD